MHMLQKYVNTKLVKMVAYGGKGMRIQRLKGKIYSYQKPNPWNFERKKVQVLFL